MSHTDTCPYCRFPIGPQDLAVVCRECGIVHHRECWEANRRCTTYGCEGRGRDVGRGARDVAPEPDTVVVDLADLGGGGTAGRRAAQARTATQYPPVDISADDTESLAPQQQPVARGRYGVRRFLGAMRAALIWAALAYGAIWAAGQMAHVSPRALIPPTDVEKSSTLDRIVAHHEHLRTRPSAQALTVAELRMGALVRLISTTRDWAKVRTRDGREGYVPRSSLRTVESQRKRSK